MKFEYDREADAGYVRLREGVKVARTKKLDDLRLIDYGADGKPVGVELLSVSKGVNLDDLPSREGIDKLLAKRKIRVYA